MIFNAPNRISEEEYLKCKHSVFLAGSITPWREQIIPKLDKPNTLVCNPMRSDWNFPEDSRNNDFRKQIGWELEYITKSNIVVFYFDPSTQSPISLLELGSTLSQYTCLTSETPKIHLKRIYEILVCCPKGYWKKGNVDITCEAHGFKVIETFDELLTEVDALTKKL
jgi:hypothetical protein